MQLIFLHCQKKLKIKVLNTDTKIDQTSIDCSLRLKTASIKSACFEIDYIDGII